MYDQVLEHGDAKNMTATTTVLRSAVSGRLLGIFCASASNTPTIQVTDAAGAVIVNTFVPAAATYHKIPATLTNGLIIVIGGTVDCTAFTKGG